ncbi:MAG: NAD(P)/FAD-dependent oxidoreductase [Acidobacteria bacterium]|nr:NAD(P)/FAD-dependent oxidoreductase [Acidobacteriota bacterium]
MDWDVIIVGAGPAGATAALRLAGKARVLVLDKEDFPRDKPCGGGISARVLTRFPELQRLLKNIPVQTVHRVLLHSPSGLECSYRQKAPLYLMVRRWDFDNLLLREAERRGARVQTETVTGLDLQGPKVSVQTRHLHCTASLVIGCDGVNSVVARASGLRSSWLESELAIDMMEETPYGHLDYREKDTMEIFYGYQHTPGYVYLFPKADHLNVGLGWKMQYFKRHIHGAPYKHHRALVDTLVEDGTLRGSSDRACFRPFTIPVGGVLGRTYSDRLMLCGDAAGFVNAFTAEGIYYAMISGDLAAHTALQALHANDCGRSRLASYQRRWQKEIGAELEFSLRVQRLLLDDTMRVDRVVRAASQDPKLLRILAGYVTGQVSHRSFRRFLFSYVMKQGIQKVFLPWRREIQEGI